MVCSAGSLSSMTAEGFAFFFVHVGVCVHAASVSFQYVTPDVMQTYHQSSL